MTKPADLFDRDAEWRSLEDWIDVDRPGAALGLVYGRRRQGKTYLLQALAETRNGFYFPLLQQSSRQNLDRLASAYRQFTDTRVPVVFSDWDQALAALLALGDRSDEPVLVVLDEFPYLLDTVAELPSILQAQLSPRGDAARRWRTRLILCGSALSTMRGLLSGTASLRGRASLELMVHPFDYRDAAEFWGLSSDPDAAVRLDALIGGTPAYRDMAGGRAPASGSRFDHWVVSSLLNPASAMFREGNVLLSEEPRITDTGLYLSVLAAISGGATRRGQIASAIGRPTEALAHPLAVLTDARLIEPLADALKDRRTSYTISEPVIRLNQLVIRPNEAQLARHHGSEVWSQASDTVSAGIYGPHFESVARQWVSEWAAETTVGGSASRVGPTTIACREHNVNHEVDVVVVQDRPQESARVIAIGEAKWQSVPCGLDQLQRLDHVRDLLAADARILLFSRKGFTHPVTAAATDRDDVELVDLTRLYVGS